MNGLETLRTEAGLTQAALAKAAGISQGTISQLERGTYAPNLTLAQRLAQILATQLERPGRDVFLVLCWSDPTPSTPSANA